MATTDYSKAININPQLAEAYENRAIVHAKNGDKQKAISDLQQAAELYQARSDLAGYEKVIQLLKQLQK